jgi:hypothetical protein
MEIEEKKRKHTQDCDEKEEGVGKRKHTTNL